jgi:hypothetical protein
MHGMCLHDGQGLQGWRAGHHCLTSVIVHIVHLASCMKAFARQSAMSICGGSMWGSSACMQPQRTGSARMGLVVLQPGRSVVLL